MSPGEAVSKLRSTPAPNLAPAAVSKQEIGTAPQRSPDLTLLNGGHHIAKERIVSHGDAAAIPVRYAADFRLMACAAHLRNCFLALRTSVCRME